MTTTEKIKVFNDIKGLISEIEEDKTSNDILKNRYAVRFIMLDNFNVFQELSLNLAELGVETFGLETLLLHENRDRWITQDELKSVIKRIAKPTIVSSFSEIVRFYNEERFLSFFNEIALLENSSNELNRRIYIPLIGLESRFNNFLASFGRIEESAPVWSVKSGELQPVTIYLTPNTDNFPEKYRGLQTMYDWLLFWKTKAPTEKIICSSLPINVYYKYSRPDNIFDIQQIKTAYEFIVKYLNIQVEIDYKEDEENMWLELLSCIDDKGQNFSFKTFIEKYFNVQRLSVKDVVNKWSNGQCTEFSRWLLKHYSLKYLSENNYLYDILTDCLDYSQFALYQRIAIAIFDNVDNIGNINDRKKMLNLLDKQYKLPEDELKRIKELTLELDKKDTNKAISLCTGRFEFEKELFINWFKIRKITLKQLNNRYSDFVAYMEDISLDGWVNKYIQSYKYSKVTNEYTEEIKKIIIEKNANEKSFFDWYNSNEFEKSIELLIKDKPDKVYWVDGLGIEYLSLIQHLISESVFKIEKLLVAKTGIPSNTELNKFENATKIETLDKYIHNNIYDYPKTICDEIDIVKDIFAKILNQPPETRIAIVSDHGLTSLSRLVSSKKYTAKASHEGRYMKIDNADIIEDTDYVRHRSGGDLYKIALTHASLNTKPVREVHGGCTPEEVLVPYILISNKKSKKKQVGKTTLNNQAIPKDDKPKTKGFIEEDLF